MRQFYTSFILLQSEGISVSKLLFIGTISMLGIATVLVFLISYLYWRDNKIALENKLLKLQIDTREQLKQQIQDEIHDNIAQLVSSAKLLLGMTERAISMTPPSLLTAQQTLGQAVKELRLLAKPSKHENAIAFNFTQSLNSEIGRLKVLSKLEITINEYDEFPINDDKKQLVFRIFQEAFQNISRHSNASILSINIAQDTEWIRIVVADDGSCFDERANPGLGTFTIKNRIKTLKGKLERTYKNSLNTLLITIPIYGHEQRSIENCNR